MAGLDLKMELRRRETLATQLIEVLRGRIEGGTYGTGDRLPSEHALIAEFGVSRTVVREAIANLRAIGLVSSRQGVGAFVSKADITPPYRVEEDSLHLVHEVAAVLEVRISLESETAYLAAIRRDDAALAEIRGALDSMAAAIAAGDDAVQADLDFHGAVARATGNKHFLSLFNYLGKLLIPRTRLRTFALQGASRSSYLGQLIEEHRRIFDAIERRDPEGARAGMRIHLNGSRERLLASAGVPSPQRETGSRVV